MREDARSNYTQARYESLADIANAAGEHPTETWIRLTLESDGKLLFHHRGFNVNLEKLITTEWAMAGLGDAGAHVSGMIDSGWATFVLSHWYRDKGTYTLPEAVRRITSVPAHVLGLKDRGTLAAGAKADINVIEIRPRGGTSTVHGVRHPRWRTALPAAGGGLPRDGLQRAGDAVRRRAHGRLRGAGSAERRRVGSRFAR